MTSKYGNLTLSPRCSASDQPTVYCTWGHSIRWLQWMGFWYLCRSEWRSRPNNHLPVMLETIWRVNQQIRSLALSLFLYHSAFRRREEIFTEKKMIKNYTRKKLFLVYQIIFFVAHIISYIKINTHCSSNLQQISISWNCFRWVFEGILNTNDFNIALYKQQARIGERRNQMVGQDQCYF